MPGSCWNHMVGNWFADEGLRQRTMPGGGNYGPESFATMLRTIFTLSVLAGGLLSANAIAAPTQDSAPPIVRVADTGGILVAQDGNLDIYY
ncbi:MAG: hypothetical protein E5Y29_24255, partial [Mesorhizobium sp.]